MVEFHKKTHGFTIVEVLVALAILVFGVYEVYAHFLDSAARGREHINDVQARFIAHQELQELLACPYDKLRTWKPPAVPNPKLTALKFIYQDTVTTRTDGLLEVTVRVGWNIPGGKGFENGPNLTVKGLKAP